MMTDEQMILALLVEKIENLGGEAIITHEEAARAPGDLEVTRYDDPLTLTMRFESSRKQALLQGEIVDDEQRAIDAGAQLILAAGEERRAPWRDGRCNEPGPWSAVCTEFPDHRYSHYDGSKDASWQDDWREDTPPLGGGTLIDEDEITVDNERNDSI